MSWEVTPTTWTIDESERSEMVFSVTNNGWWNNSYIEVKSSAHFSCSPREKTITAGSSETFVVKYLPNQRISMSEMFLTFFSGPWNYPRFQIEIKKTKNTIFVSKCVSNHQEQNSDFLECKICLLKFDEYERAPRMLTCGHSLCSECAESLWKDQNREKIICPFDRKVTTVSNSQLGINNLPKNFSLLERLESEKESKVVKPLSNSEPSDTPCAENPHHEATVFCVNCEVDLCKKCFTITHGSKIFQSHKKLPFSEKPIQLPKCLIHPYSTAEFQCQESSCSQPSKLFCHTCSLQEHNGHSYEHLMETASKNQQKLEKLISNIRAKMGILQNVVQLQERRRASYQPNSSLLLERRNNIIEQFELKKRAALSDFDSEVDERKQRCQQKDEKLESQSRNVSEIKKEIAKILKSKVNLFRIDDVAKRAEDFLDEEFEYFDAFDSRNIYLNEKMELQWEEKK